jgi:hypothetical protein
MNTTNSSFNISSRDYYYNINNINNINDVINNNSNNMLLII